MELLVVYDVATDTAAGAARLHRVARICQAYGQRVQKSVFDCVLAPEQVELLRYDLLQVIGPAKDSIRIYRLREPRKRFTFIAGRRPEFDVRGPGR